MKAIETCSKVMVVPGYQCNNRCVFCVNAAKHELPARSTLEVKREILAAARRGCDYLEFAGGEATIRPDFFDLLSAARGYGFKKVSLATNGRMFSYPGFAGRAHESGLTDVIFSVHGHTAALHDGLTRVRGSFAQLRSGLENALKYFPGRLGTNTAVTRRNYRALPKIGAFLQGFGFCNSEFIYADPNYGGVKDNFKALMPRISDCAPYLRACLDLNRARITARGQKMLGNNWSARYVPLCYFSEYYPGQISEAREALIFSRVQHAAPDYTSLDAIKGRREHGRAKTAKCAGCALYARCEGIWQEYLRVYGDGELKPLKRLPKKVK